MSVEPKGGSLRSAWMAAFNSALPAAKNFSVIGRASKSAASNCTRSVGLSFAEARFERGQCRFAIDAGLAGRSIEHDHDVARLRLGGVGWRHDAEREVRLAIFAGIGCQFRGRLFRVGSVRGSEHRQQCDGGRSRRLSKVRDHASDAMNSQHFDAPQMQR